MYGVITCFENVFWDKNVEDDTTSTVEMARVDNVNTEVDDSRWLPDSSTTME